MEPSSTLLMLERAKELAARGISVIDLGAGEPDFPTPARVCAAGKEALDRGLTKYTSVAGSPELRAAVADRYNRRYGTSLTPAHVIAGTGGKQELFNLVLALVEPGDEVIIPSPYWVSYRDQVSFAGGVPVHAPSLPENGFRPRADEIERVITDRTRGVIINSPSNPTGAVIEEAELRGIIELCVAHELFLIFDETYEFFTYDGRKHVSAMRWFEEYPETIAVVNSLSKTFAMTGWRLGFAVAHPGIIAALGKIQGHSTSNPSSISQHAAIEALRGGDGDDDIRLMHETYATRRDWIVPALAAIPGIECAPPDGAFYVFPRVNQLFGRKGISDSETFATFLLDEARVAVVPGSAFGVGEYIRISYANSLENIQEGVRRMRGAIDRLM